VTRQLFPFILPQRIPQSGFKSSGGLLPTPVLYFNEVGSVIFPLYLSQATHRATRRDGSNITAQFTPKLRAYVTSDYKETEILKGEIHSPLLWEKNLAELAETTTWNLTRDPATGRYTIAEA
jgi:hypothetical protein